MRGARVLVSSHGTNLWSTAEDLDGDRRSRHRAHQLKVELLDTYKNKPPLATVHKNDLAVLVAIVYTM